MGTMGHLVEQASSEITLGWSSAAAGETMFIGETVFAFRKRPTIFLSLSCRVSSSTTSFEHSQFSDQALETVEHPAGRRLATADLHQSVSEPERSSGSVGGPSGDARSGRICG